MMMWQCLVGMVIELPTPCGMARDILDGYIQVCMLQYCHSIVHYLKGAHGMG